MRLQNKPASLIENFINFENDKHFTFNVYLLLALSTNWAMTLQF